MFKRLLKALKRVYEKYTGRFQMPGATKYMSVEEFFDLICSCGVVNEDFGQREISILFNLSMFTQKNELDFDRHFNMTFNEFIEAIGRVSEKISIVPLFEDLDQSLEGSQLLGKKSKEHPLHKKIEALIFRMIKAAIPNAYAHVEKTVREFYTAQKTQPKKTNFVMQGGPYKGRIQRKFTLGELPL